MRILISQLKDQFIETSIDRYAWQETASLLKIVPYWLFFVLVGSLVSVTGAFDTYLIIPIAERSMFVGASMILWAISFAILFGLFRALTGQHPIDRIDVVLKFGLLCVPLLAIAWRVAIANVSETTVSLGPIIRCSIECYAIVPLAIASLYFSKFGRNISMRKTAFGKILAHEAAPNPGLHVPNYIESEDHYLKIVHCSGAKYIRGRLDHVAAELSNYGFRCHRSYWVSRYAIDRRCRRGRQLMLVLKDGTKIPVSRSYEKAVREALD